MGEKRYLPDTSAILTLMEDEPGADTVDDILRHQPIILPAMVLLEVYYISSIRKNRSVAEQRYALLKNLPATHVTDLTEPVLLQAGDFKAQYHLSLADAVIAAHAAIYQTTLVHKDPEYEPLQMIDQIILPYKAKASAD